MAAGVNRRENLEFLVACHATQSELAKVLAHDTLTQPIISSILRRKRLFHECEARDVERIIGLPEGWMDNYSLRKGWPLIREFRRFDSETKKIVNGLLKFIAESK